MINLLSSMKVIKNERLKKQKKKMIECLLLGTHQDGGIGVFSEMKKKRQKTCGDKHRPFCV